MYTQGSQSGFIFPNREALREPALEVVTSSGMIREDHWRFASGMHANVKADFDFASENPEHLDLVASMMADQVVEAVRLNDLPEPDAVVGVPKGAEGLASVMVPKLSEAFDKDIAQVYVTKFPEFRPVKFWVTDPTTQLSQLDMIDGSELALLGVEDVTTTWGSTRGSISAIATAARDFYRLDMTPTGMVSFAERQGVDNDVEGDPMRVNVIDLHVDQWNQEDCGDCERNIPIAQGSGEPASREIVQKALFG